MILRSVRARVNQRYSTLRGRPLTRYEQAVERLAASRAGAWTFFDVLGPIDRRGQPVTHGRLSVAIGAPVGLLETRGARTGRLRRIPLLYALDGESVILVGSNGGSSRDPAWLHNVRARGEVRFLSRGRGWRAYRAHVAAGAERARLWELVNDLYAGYDAYQAHAGAREIPVVVLAPLSGAR
jgi:deazaflavin-dependent oxidoreductase (nitroreductase family)